MSELYSGSPYYEVNFEISREDPYKFKEWLQNEHFDDLIALTHDFGSGPEPIFSSIEIGQELSLEGETSKKLYLRCFVKQIDRVEIYIDSYLPLMRAKGIEHHGEGLDNGAIKILGVKTIIERSSSKEI